MLELRALSIDLAGTPILRRISFAIEAGETLGIVGESGSGKSMTALAIMGLLPPVMRATGEIRFEGRNLLALDDAAMADIRGRRFGMIFQEPMTALNPVHRVGRQIAEIITQHGLMSQEAATAEAVRLIGRVGLDNPERRLNAYPHELSGGQRQRIMIAMAIACRPALLIADEPTSALDVTVQAEILELLADLQAEFGMAMLFVSHDLAVIAKIARRVLVMYGGAVMETGETRSLLAAPRHPYTRGLLAALPHGKKRGERLRPIAGQVPPPARIAPGCPFHGRCPKGDERCRTTPPPPSEGATLACCWYPEAPA